jgi:hypothetical protein
MEEWGCRWIKGRVADSGEGFQGLQRASAKDAKESEGRKGAREVALGRGDAYFVKLRVMV